MDFMFGIINKKGDTNWFIISMILVLATLVLFILAIGYYPWKQTIDREACHTSILISGSIPDTVATSAVKSAVSLRCKSRNICITTKTFGKGDCDDFKEFDTVRVSGSMEEVDRKIKMFLAQEMADCWSMFGQGNLEIFSRSWDVKDDTKSSGIICSRIQFDDNVLNGNDGLEGTPDDIRSIDGFMYYLISHKVPENNISYMDYLTGNPDGASAKAFYGGLMGTSGFSVDKDSKIIGELDLSKTKVIFYLETTKTRAGQIIAAAFIVPAFAVIGNRFGGSLVGTASTGLGIKIAMFIGDKIQDTFTGDLPNGRKSLPGMFLVDYDAKGFGAYNIDSFENIA